MKKKLLMAIMSVAMVFSLNGLHAFAAEPNELDIGKSASATDTAHQYDVTFTLPTQAMEEPETVDIVFVLDTTTISSFSAVKQQFNDFVDKLNAQDNLIVNIGIVTFNINVSNKLNGLMELNDANITAIKNGFAASYTAGSNMYGGLLIGKDILDSGTADHKYIVLASDFGGYKSDAGNGTGVSQFFMDGTIIGFNTNNSDFNGKYYYTQAANSEASVLTVDAIANLIDNKVFFNGTPVDSQTEPYLLQAGAAIGEYPDSWQYSFIHTFTEAEKATMPTYTLTRSAAWPTMMEKNIYLTGNLFKDMKASGYNVMAVTTPYQPQTGAGGEAYKIKFNTVTNSYKDWFEQEIGTRYETTNGDTFLDMLDDIESELIYLLGKGKITDVVHPDFKIVPGIQPTVLLNDVALAVTDLGNGSYGFGSEDNGVYPYVYNVSTDVNGKETVTWDINKEATKDDVLKFTFRIELKDIPNQPGDYTYDTNESAVVDYMDSKEAKEGVSDFTKQTSLPSPQVTVKRVGVLVRHVDEAGNALCADTLLVGSIGENYTTERSSFAGYTFKQMHTESAAVTGRFSENLLTVTYIYATEKEAPVQPELPVTGQNHITFIGLGLVTVLASGGLLFLRRKFNK
ncbi:MucBP domain-containing protein [Culicoidibacter larvae]|uniref:LPXTG cell wall anchor domain-containing protein n=1 Tax=Culicoidibacter larvae TaxID=2579976 RepID=A0A5R8QAS7_9FIRM|nr:MucBP domain-containing protein [Culicoidibacter larvae]TLG73016.1 LPXTG cell wall anchor domain-containing protein [Culicoidibacter larvae]